MENPYVLLAGTICAVAIFGSGVKIGIDWQQGRDAIAAQKDVAAAVERQKVEGKKQVENAVKFEKVRAAARLRQQNLEQELAKDEIAHNCRVSVGTFSVLKRSIEDANKTIAGSGHGPVPADSSASGFFRSRSGPLDWFSGTRPGGSVPASAKSDRLDK